MIPQITHIFAKRKEGILLGSGPKPQSEIMVATVLLIPIALVSGVAHGREAIVARADFFRVRTQDGIKIFLKD